MENNTKIYQTVLLIPQSDWFALNERLNLLEQGIKLNESSPKINVEDDYNVFLKFDKASEFLGIDPRSLIRAGNQGRINRLKAGGAGYSYRLSELKRYKEHKGRNKRNE